MTVSSENSIAAALVALQTELTEIKAKLDRIEKKLNDPDADTVQHSTYRAKMANPAVLDKITYPKNPTKARMTAYIYKILDASQDQNSFSERDIQIDMLMKVGEENLDLLIATLPHIGHRTNHIMSAIKQLASVKSKAVVLKYLDRYTELVDVVFANRWEKDARKILLTKLKTNPQYLPQNWIMAVIALKDPKTYPILIDYFIHGGNKANTYEMIKRLPDVKLEEAVAKAWHFSTMERDEWSKIMMAVIAVRYGHLDALEALVENQQIHVQHFKDMVRQAILTSTDASGSPSEIIDWFHQNKAKLVFDPITKKFKVKAGKNPARTAKKKD